MNWQENRLELTVMMAAAAGMVSIFSMIHFLHVKKGTHVVEISYEMPRPKSSYSPELDLANREIIRNYINPNAKKQGAESATNEKAKMTLLEKSKQTAKKNAQAAAAAAKKPEVKIDVVSKDPDKDGSASDSGPGDSNTKNNFFDPNALSKNQAKIPNPKKDEPEEQKDWKKIFSTTPTQQAMKEFVQAYYEQKVPEDLYFDIVRDLLKSQNEQNQDLGLYGLRSVYTNRSFYEAVQMESFPEIQKKQTLATAMENYMLSFNHSSRLSILDASLKSKVMPVVLKAVHVISAGVTKIKSGETFSESRDQRNQTVSLASYQKFIPTLKSLEQSNDPEVSQAASSILTQIQSSANVAQNP